MRAWYIREQRHILGTSDYAEVDLFETTDKEHTASARRKRELATSIAQQKYNDMIARRYFCQLAYTNFGEKRLGSHVYIRPRPPASTRRF